MKKVFSTAFSAILLFTLINNAYGQTEIYVPNGTAGIGTSTSTGKVGIGLNNPAEKLDVLGNVKVSGNILLYGANRTIETNSTYSLFIKTAGINRVKFDNTGKTFFYGNVYLPQAASLVLGLDNANDGVNSLKLTYSTTYNHAFMNFKDNLIFRTGSLTYSPLTMQGNGSIAVGYPLNYSNDGTQYQTKGYKFAVNGTALFEDKITAKYYEASANSNHLGNALFQMLSENSLRWGIGYADLVENDKKADFKIWRYNGAANNLGTALTISRATGNWTINGQVGIGKEASTKMLDVNGEVAGNFFSAHGGGDVVNGSYPQYYLNNYLNQNRWAIATANKETDGDIDKKGSDFYLFKFKANGDFDGHSLYINREQNYWSIPGNVGIGVNDPGIYKLAVNGKIIATEIVVKEYDNWPDYVFANNYNLRSLGEVENFINENGHLPEVPSAKVVEETGVGVGEMNAVLLKKVEELTLYAIQQGKLIKALEEKLEKMEAAK